MSGTLSVKPLSGAFTKDGDLFGKSDPYIEIQLGNSKQQTSVCKNGGKTPKWSDVLSFRVNGEQSLMFYIMDHDSFSTSDKLAEGNINLNEVYQRRSLHNKYDPLN